MTLLKLEIPDEMTSELNDIASELGVTVADSALAALEQYLDAARVARSEDLDETEHPSRPTSAMISRAPGNTEKVGELEGTEPWLGTEA